MPNSKKTHSSGRNLKPASNRFPLPALIAAVVVLIVAVGAAVVLLSNRGAVEPLPQAVSVTDAAARRDAGALMLDVREPSEWIDYHVDGATLIPLGQLPNRLSEVPKDRDIVVVCHSGNRSQKGRDILLQAGFPRVTSMTGGLLAWQSQGLALVKGQ